MNKVSPLIQHGILCNRNALQLSLLEAHLKNNVSTYLLLKNHLHWLASSPLVVNSYLNTLAWGVFTWSILKNLGPHSKSHMSLLFQHTRYHAQCEWLIGTIRRLIRPLISPFEVKPKNISWSNSWSPDCKETWTHCKNNMKLESMQGSPSCLGISIPSFLAQCPFPFLAQCPRLNVHSLFLAQCPCLALCPGHMG